MRTIFYTSGMWQKLNCSPISVLSLHRKRGEDGYKSRLNSPTLLAGKLLGSLHWTMCWNDAGKFLEFWRESVCHFHPSFPLLPKGLAEPPAGGGPGPSRTQEGGAALPAWTTSQGSCDMGKTDASVLSRHQRFHARSWACPKQKQGGSGTKCDIGKCSCWPPVTKVKLPLCPLNQSHTVCTYLFLAWSFVIHFQRQDGNLTFQKHIILHTFR